LQIMLVTYTGLLVGTWAPPSRLPVPSWLRAMTS